MVKKLAVRIDKILRKNELHRINSKNIPEIRLGDIECCVCICVVNVRCCQNNITYIRLIYSGLSRLISVR